MSSAKRKIGDEKTTSGKVMMLKKQKTAAPVPTSIPASASPGAATTPEDGATTGTEPQGEVTPKTFKDLVHNALFHKMDLN